MAAPDIRSLLRSGPGRTAAIVVVLIVVALLFRGAGDDDAPSAGSASATAQPLAPAEVAGPGQLTIGSTVVVPRPANDDHVGTLRSSVGRTAEAQQVLVLSVPADEGFWVGSGPLDRIWVQITGSGESPVVVRASQRASFTGTVVAHDSGFAARIGVNVLEGASRLTSEGAHLQVARSSLTLAG
ncbi:hypothetical protein [Cryptosporangium sp. NPDC048952]|uniref:hypothetical protein n=1 Tax=Cryptosporangium sp. NPDC048952 TaxID=3363961 RepID=UPI0037247785